MSDSLPFLKWLDLGGYKSAMKKTAKEMDSIMGSWLEEHRRMRLSGDVEGREDFIHVMLSTLEGAKLSADYDQDSIFKALSLVCYLPPPLSLSLSPQTHCSHSKQQTYHISRGPVMCGIGASLSMLADLAHSFDSRPTTQKKIMEGKKIFKIGILVYPFYSNAPKCP